MGVSRFSVCILDLTICSISCDVLSYVSSVCLSCDFILSFAVGWLCMYVIPSVCIVVALQCVGVFLCSLHYSANRRFGTCIVLPSCVVVPLLKKVGGNLYLGRTFLVFSPYLFCKMVGGNFRVVGRSFWRRCIVLAVSGFMLRAVWDMVPAWVVPRLEYAGFGI